MSTSNGLADLYEVVSKLPQAVFNSLTESQDDDSEGDESISRKAEAVFNSSEVKNLLDRLQQLICRVSWEDYNKAIVRLYRDLMKLPLDYDIPYEEHIQLLNEDEFNATREVMCADEDEEEDDGEGEDSEGDEQTGEKLSTAIAKQQDIVSNLWRTARPYVIGLGVGAALAGGVVLYLKYRNTTTKTKKKK